MGQTIVAVAQWAAYRDPDNFTRPLEFLPERWMGASGFEKDRQDVFQPFGFGHRDCIARK
jgi:cytochrome P450